MYCVTAYASDVRDSFQAWQSLIKWCLIKVSQNCLIYLMSIVKEWQFELSKLIQTIHVLNKYILMQ